MEQKTNRREAFIYTYSAKDNAEIEQIRQKYMPHEENKVERLKKLDHVVQMAGVIPSLTVGIIGCLVFGIGMCFFLNVFTGAPWLIALLMILGVVIMLPAYPVFRHISKKTKNRIAPEILRLSDELMGKQ